MKTSTMFATAGFAALAAATPVQPKYPFTLTSIHSGNVNVHLQAVNAVDGSFMIDNASREPTTYCPPQTPHCPPGNFTGVVYGASEEALYMNVEVAGGQQAYVNPNGALAYTEPHSSVLPKGSVYKGFTYTPPGKNGLGELSFSGITAKGYAQGFVACPAANLGAPYTIYVDFKGVSPHGECIGVGLATSEYKNGPAAFEYTV